MDHNEICMHMDVKLDIHDKRANELRYKTWTRCLVKIEAIKCLPCFLRFSFQCAADTAVEESQHQPHKVLSVSVNVPGVSISLATSRTKQHSYGLFWTQNRRDCFIYLALETDTACRRHMRWIKKSIKNLELYRQVFLEQRRMSRGSSAQNVLGPLPKLPDSFDASTFSPCASRVSDIYEEIFDGSRISRASIASGIYEEMKPSAVPEAPPVVPPPLPAHRKRINTFECAQQNGMLGDIPRSNTNPESELAKKKKYKNILENFFGNTRQKRTTSTRELTQQQKNNAVVHYENTPARDDTPPPKRVSNLNKSQRNSFSSPDLSKLNFVDTFGEAQIAGMLHMLSDDSNCDELSISLDESDIQPVTRNLLLAKINKQLAKADSLESLNVSQHLPHNFNFSACNTSTINLIGSNGAVPHSSLQKNKILVDDLTGYCVMAPILKKTCVQLDKQPTTSTVSTSSGYSTGSYCSSSSSCNNEDQQPKVVLAAPTPQVIEPLPTPPPPPPIVMVPIQNDSDIYEPMHGSSLNSTETPSATNSGFADHLYENLLAVKATQELEQPLGYGISTSTPTESPLPTLPLKGTPKQQSQPNIEPEEDYYQTPRKSIISVDEKVPSYYPNSCDTLKSKRSSPKIDNAAGLKNLVSVKLRRERKENLYISSPHQIIEQRQKQSPTSSTSWRHAIPKTKSQTKKTAAHKISEGVYAVTHASSNVKRSSNSNNNNNNNNNNVDSLSVEMQQKMEEDLVQLAMLQNIDFKFDDHKSPDSTAQADKTSTHMPDAKQSAATMVGIVQPKLEEEYEHCFQAAERATRLLQKYATLAKFGKSPSKSPQQQHQLQINQSSNIKAQQAAAVGMTQSVATPTELQPSGMKKFASLPRFKKIDFSPLKLRLNNVLQRHQQPSPVSQPSLEEQQHQ